MLKKFLSLPTALHFTIGLLLAVAGSLSSIYSQLNASFAEVVLILNVVLNFYWMIYPYVIVSGVIEKVSTKNAFSYKFFLFNWIVIFLGLILLAIASYIFQQDEFHFNGLPVLLVFYFMYAFFYTFLFTARLIKTIEKDRLVSYGESIWAALGLAIIPLNFLMLHSRIIKALNKVQVTMSKPGKLTSSSIP